MEAQVGRARQIEPARAQMGFDGRSLGRLRCLPDRQGRLGAFQGIGIMAIGNLVLGPAGEAECGSPRRFPQAAMPKGGDYVALIAPGMAAHKNLAVLRGANRKTWLAIIMHRTGSHPRRTRLPPAKRPGDGFSGHQRPPWALFVCSEAFTSIAGSCSIQARRSSASTSVRRPRFTARSAPDLMAS